MTSGVAPPAIAAWKTANLPTNPDVSGMPANVMQEQREDARDQRRPLAEPGPAGQVVRLAAGVAHQRDHRERADRAQPVGRQVEQRRRQARTDEEITAVRMNPAWAMEE